MRPFCPLQPFSSCRKSAIVSPRRRAWIHAVAAALLAAATAREALADRRHFVWTYEAQTVPRGEAEVETYTTFTAPETDRTRGVTSTQLQFELEVGMNDRFDTALYHVFAQSPGEALEYDGYKLRLRYKTSDGRGAFPVASVAYLEFSGRPDFTGEELEAKFILGRDRSSYSIAVNPILALEAEGDEWEVEPGYAAGAAWKGDLASFGFEIKGGEHGHYLGPVLGHGVEHLWMTLGSAFLLDGDDGEPELQARFLIGFKVR